MVSRPEDEIDLMLVLNWFWRKKYWLLVFVFIGAALGVGLSYLATEQYTASVTLIPRTTTNPSSFLSRLTALGNLQGQDESISENLYGHVLRSDLILDKVTAKSWVLDSNSPPISLFELFFPARKSKTEGHRTQKQLLDLKRVLRRKVVGFDSDAMNGFMTVSVTVPREPVLAAELANFLVSELELFNQGVHSSKSRKHKEFVSDRLKSVQSQLEESEDALMAYVQKNRNYSDSPLLAKRYGELEREVLANRTVWIDLRSQLESAKIEEFREMTSIRILDDATVPVEPSSPSRPLFLFSGVSLGFLLGIIFSIGHSLVMRK